jgi:hypothetical protein
MLVSTSNVVETRMRISNASLPLLGDGVFEVRKAAAKALCIASNCDRKVANMVKSKGVSPEGEPLQDIGRMWLDCVVLPQLETLRTSKTFSNRVMSLHLIATLLKEDLVKIEDVRYNILIGIALTLANDPIPNVRLALCVMLGCLAAQITKLNKVLAVTEPQQEAVHSINERPNVNVGDSSPVKMISPQHTIIQNQIYNRVEKVLTTLIDDKDRDVKYFAQQARDNLNDEQVQLNIRLDTTNL